MTESGNMIKYIALTLTYVMSSILLQGITAEPGTIRTLQDDVVYKNLSADYQEFLANQKRISVQEGQETTPEAIIRLVNSARRYGQHASLITACDQLPVDRKQHWYQQISQEPFKNHAFQLVLLTVLGSAADRQKLLQYYDSEDISARERKHILWGISYLDPEKERYRSLFELTIRFLSEPYPEGHFYQYSVFSKRHRQLWEPTVHKLISDPNRQWPLNRYLNLLNFEELNASQLQVIIRKLREDASDDVLVSLQAFDIGWNKDPLPHWYTLMELVCERAPESEQPELFLDLLAEALPFLPDQSLPLFDDCLRRTIANVPDFSAIRIKNLGWSLMRWSRVKGSEAVPMLRQILAATPSPALAADIYRAILVQSIDSQDDVLAQEVADFITSHPDQLSPFVVARIGSPHARELCRLLLTAESSRRLGTLDITGLHWVMQGMDWEDAVAYSIKQGMFQPHDPIRVRNLIEKAIDDAYDPLQNPYYNWLLYAEHSGSMASFDAETDQFPNRHDALITETLAPITGGIFAPEKAVEVYRQEKGHYEVIFANAGQWYHLICHAGGDWYDLSTVLEAVNKALEDQGTALRLVPLEGGGQLAEWLSIDPAKLPDIQQTLALPLSGWSGVDDQRIQGESFEQKVLERYLTTEGEPNK